jgi:hypothetical protein
MAWSYSALKDFETCKRKYHEVRVMKHYKREDTEQSLYGEALHTAAEEYVRSGTPMPAPFDYMKPLIDALLTKPGRKYPEHEMALTAELIPCTWTDPDVWVRGIADLLILEEDGDVAWVADYKTGNDKYADKDQLDLMSLLVFEHFPSVVQVNSALIFVVKDAFVKHKRYVTEKDEMWWGYRNRVAKIDAAHATGVWNPTQSGLCKRYCQVLSCEFNGRN